MTRLRVLLLEDQPADAELTLAALGDGGFACEPTVAATRPEFEAAFRQGAYDLVVADYRLPAYSGLEALRYVRERDALVPFVLVSGALGEERAVEALRAGATDYVLKDSLARLPTAVGRALEERRDHEHHVATRRALEISQERLRGLSRRLLEVQEQERARLARDLHDDVGQLLTALKIRLESLARDDAAVGNRLLECIETAQLALERVRQLSFALRPAQLDDLGLAAALRAHVQRQAGVAGIKAHFEAAETPADVSPEVETACFRVAQEAITNVLRHARARNVWVRLASADARLELAVRDDGDGFDLDAARRGLGLVGMEERVAQAGGALSIRTAPGQGTVLLATFALR
ncbi:MAG TPA: response regulator [Burkholderiales bacterium]|nr:response regulator [Burkholderiales bacterium]